MLGIKSWEWDPYIAELFRMLKPGGWIQAGEICQPTWDGDAVPSDSYYYRVTFPQSHSKCTVPQIS